MKRESHGYGAPVACFHWPGGRSGRPSPAAMTRAHSRSSSGAIKPWSRTRAARTPARSRAATARIVARLCGSRLGLRIKPTCSPSSWAPHSTSIVPPASTSHAPSVAARGTSSRSVPGSSPPGRRNRSACARDSRQVGLSSRSSARRPRWVSGSNPARTSALRRSIVSGALRPPERRFNLAAIASRLSASAAHHSAMMRRVGSDARNLVLSAALAIISA